MSVTENIPIADDASGAKSPHRLDMCRVILDYEIRSSWWACWLSNSRLQDIAASYFAWKVRRKCRRWRRYGGTR